MKKLNLNELEVDSFETESQSNTRGTVHGADDAFSEPTTPGYDTCNNWDTCQATCDQSKYGFHTCHCYETRWHSDETCGGNATCNGAGTCDASWTCMAYDTCGATCGLTECNPTSCFGQCG